MSDGVGIMRPNPALLHGLDERQKLKSRPVIAHDLGAGERCIKCGPKCPGFQLHYWRKHCSNCRCGKADHNVSHDSSSTDVGFYFVGKIFERPMRSKDEVKQFCYGTDDDELDWAPDNITKALARRYLKQLPESKIPIVGSEGAQERKKRFEKQFPVHDIEPERCHELPPEELKSMEEYIGHVKRDVAGLGVVCEVDLSELPPPPPELLEPIYEPHLVDAKPCYVEPSDPVEKTGNVCEWCSDELNCGDVAIRAERAGPSKVWHPQCFKCSKCDELLVDLLYYYKSGKVYCARDYAVVANIPRCAACDELIFATEFTGAENKTWHLRHFCCFECDKPLAGHKYVPDDGGQPHCLQCFQSKHGKLCRSCGLYISPEEQRLTLEMDGSVAHWHSNPNCFSCKVCKKSLIGSKMIVKFGTILCSSECFAELSSVKN